MPRQYTVVSGDTLRTISQRFLGTPNKEAELLAFNRLRLKGDAVHSGDVLLIPERTSARTAISPFDSDGEQVIFTAGGKSFFNFEAVKIFRAIDSVAHGFILEIVLDSDGLNIPIKPFGYETCVLSIGGETVVTGRVEHLESSISAEGSLLLVQGRSLAGVLADVSYQGRPLQFKDQGLEKISRLLMRSHEVDPVFLADEGASFTRAAIGQDEPIFSFLSRLANMRGLLATSNSLGQLVFLSADFDAEPVSSIVEGEGNFLGAKASFDGTARYSDISIDGQRRGGLATIRESATDKTLSGVNRPLTIQAGLTPEDDLLSAVKWERGKRIADSSSITVTVDGWKRIEDNELWQVNQCVNAKIPSCFIRKSTKMLIKSVEFSRDVDGTFTKLGFALPGSFTTNEPTSITPW